MLSRSHARSSLTRRIRPTTGLALLLGLLGTATPVAAIVDMLPDVPKGVAPSIFDDHMVLQRDMAVPVFGKAAPGEMVSVTFNGQIESTVGGPDGRWTVFLDPMPAGGPFELTVIGDNTLQFTDVMIGDVWVFSGQSNMLIKRPSPSVLPQYPNVRSISRRGWSDRPGGTPFWIGVQLSEWLGVPVGVINRAARGAGSGIQTWLPPSAATDPDPELQALLPTFGAQLYNAYESLIRPVVPYGIRGVIWWQGEGDLRNISELPPSGTLAYRIVLPAMIRAWRNEWNQADFPFIFLQLPVGQGLAPDAQVAPPPAAPPLSNRASLMRQAYVGALEEPSTWMVVSIDLGGGAHPKDRDAYHDRIFRVARAAGYGDGAVYSGPVFESAMLEGNRVRIRFRTGTATGLQTNGSPLQGFSISADGQTFVWASSEIQGDEVVVWNDSISAPVEVRYGWDKQPTWANLFNVEELGAAPFSTQAIP